MAQTPLSIPMSGDVRVAIGKEWKACFLTGHGESGPNSLCSVYKDVSKDSWYVRAVSREYNQTATCIASCIR